MAYPDLPLSPTFWRCARCGNETLFRVNGIARIECGQCGALSTEAELLAAHAQPPSESKPEQTAAR
jgi:transcription elongation factor Elf1